MYIKDPNKEKGCTLLHNLTSFYIRSPNGMHFKRIIRGFAKNI